MVGRELLGRPAERRRARDEPAVAGQGLQDAAKAVALGFVDDAAGDAGLARARQVDERAARERDRRRHPRALGPATASFVTWTTISCPSLTRSSMRGRSDRSGGSPSGAASAVLLAEVEVRGVRHDVLDVEEGVAVEADRDERGLHAGQHAVNPAEVDVADEALPAPALVEDLDDAAVLEEGDARLGRRRVDEELFPHAFANRRYSTPRIRPMARNVVAIEEPP